MGAQYNRTHTQLKPMSTSTVKHDNPAVLNPIGLRMKQNSVCFHKTLVVVFICCQYETGAFK